MTTTSLLNYLSANRLVMDINNLPNLSFTIQSHNLPGLELPAPKQPTPIVDIPQMGDKIKNEPLQVTFIVTEGLENWLEIRDWMTSNASQRERVGRSIPFGAVPVTITAYDSSNNSIGQFTFIGCVPTVLSGIDTTTKIDMTTELSANLTMEFERFDYNPKV